MNDINKKAIFDFSIKLTKSNKIRKSIGGNYEGKVGKVLLY